MLTYNLNWEKNVFNIFFEKNFDKLDLIPSGKQAKKDWQKISVRNADNSVPLLY